MLRFDLLGPLRVVRDDDLVIVRPYKPRTILACVLARANERVDVDELVEEVWGGDPPPSSRANVRTYVNTIRRLLGAPGNAILSSVDGGYVIRAEPEQLDVQAFRQLVAAGRKAHLDGEVATALSYLDRAMALSRGPALADVPTGPLLSTYAATLDAELTEAAEDRAMALLQLDRPADALAQLRRLVTDHPLRERVHALMIAALYRAGDAAAALEAYQRARAILREQLGIDPGPELRQAQQAVLLRDVTVGGPGFRESVGTPRRLVGAGPQPPRQLPPAAAVLVGREREIAALHRAAAASRPRARPTVLAIHGPGGVGKSTLAVQVAHDLIDRFPDGQLYLDLHGATPADPPLATDVALARMLTALGLPSSGISGDVAEAVGQFRSRLAGRRVLMLLDNAADSAQVAPLVPAAEGCLVLVTSRVLLASLDGAAHLPVGPLTAEDSVQVLVKVLGERRVAAEPAAAAAIGRLCGHLPLSLRVAAARLVAQPTLTLGRFADRLADQRERLDLLELPELSVRASLRTSYLQLRQSSSAVDLAAARGFRLLAGLAVPEFGIDAVSALLGTPPARSEAVIDRLVELRLVDPLGSDRFRIHDLLRLVGAELAAADEPAAERSAATRRTIDHYVHSAQRAMSFIRPGIPPGSDGPTVGEPSPVATIADASAAAAWLETELPVLLAMARHHPAESALDLRRILAPYLSPRARWGMLGELAMLARDAAVESGDHAAEALALISLGLVSQRTGDSHAAFDHLGAALRIQRRIGDPQEGVTLQYLGLFCYEMNNCAEAAAYNVSALRRLRDSGTAIQRAIGLHNLSDVYAALGRTRSAERFLRRSLSLRTAEEDRFGLARGYVNLGRILAGHGELADATRWLDLGVAQAREVGYGEAEWEGYVVRAELAVWRRAGHAALDELRRAGQLTDGLGRPYLRGIVLSQLARAYRLLGEETMAESSESAAAEVLAKCNTGRDPALEVFLAQRGPAVRDR
ncbi:BTAD domain-containing putative transcriptional regulator [Plantactinospora sp. GCM10030261]|uniref:AfsR/SARP family transcriptional regulator n=1 Tax=Plantactinospora sp. GCM10030261 TaxID=3273420 RepID=UPI00360CAFE0